MCGSRLVLEAMPVGVHLELVRKQSQAGLGAERVAREPHDRRCLKYTKGYYTYNIRNSVELIVTRLTTMSFHIINSERFWR